MKSKLTLLIAILSVSLKAFSFGSETQKDTLLYFEFDIRSVTNYPIVMRGIMKKLDHSKLDLSNGKNFISSFYKQGYFVPNLLIYDDVLTESIRISNDTTLLKYLGQGEKIRNLIHRNSRGMKLILNSGENVFIRITRITGLFLHHSKKEMRLPSISDEYSINDIYEIVDIYLPTEIFYYVKPSRKCVRHMTNNLD